MALSAKMDVAQIQDLAGRVNRERANLESTLNQLRSSVTRGAEFEGNAAAQYDQFLANWATHQQGMIQAMLDAGQLLHRYAEALSDLEDQVSRGFSV